MAEASLPKKSLPKINKVDEPYWKGAAAGKLLLQLAKGWAKKLTRARILEVRSGRGIANSEQSAPHAVHVSSFQQ